MEERVDVHAARLKPEVLAARRPCSPQVAEVVWAHRVAKFARFLQAEEPRHARSPHRGRSSIRSCPCPAGRRRGGDGGGARGSEVGAQRSAKGHRARRSADSDS
eukprot:243304-Prymnesium_polylepis.1